jgi:hypothetical protein
MSVGIFRVLTTILLLAMMVAMLPNSAFADAVTFDISQANQTGLGSAPYATINLQLVGNQIQMTVTMDQGDYLWTHQNNSFIGFDSSKTISGVTFVSATNENGSIVNTQFALGASQKFDGYGTFGYAIDSPTNQYVATQISLYLSADGGFSSVYDILSPNSNGNQVALGIANGESPSVTGYATGNAPSPAPVPEPASMMLVGAGLLAVGKLRRKFWH